MFNTLLIANRGEIACRIIKTAHRLGIQCIAIYSEADRHSLHVALADKAYCVGAASPSASYLNADAILTIARQSGAEAIHPGYGFLSENPEFAQACEEAGIVFIGPSVSAMKAMASKQLAKQLLSKTAVPLTPGYHGDDQSDPLLLKEAERIGFPVLLKAANGGGGKGMRTVNSSAEFQSALEGARREAQACFGDAVMIIEKYMTRPRHIEIQLMADNFGHVVHLFERDCSIQRRHQKIIEEAPAPLLSPDCRQQLAEAAISVAHAIDYRGAGTVEFLVDATGAFYFMEMNTRLQVEHPVTEMITGLDLVEWQLRIAANEPLPLMQKDIRSEGHAIECRIYAEDPRPPFMPSTGTLHYLKEPTGDGIRIDTGVVCGSPLTMHYDPLVSKLIAYGDSRNEAIQRLTQALNHYRIVGVKTNIPLIQAIIEQPPFKAAELSTHFLTDYPPELPTLDPVRALMMAASFDYLTLNSPFNTPLQADTFAWQMHLQRHWPVYYKIDNEPYTLMITPLSHDTFSITSPTQTVTLQVARHNGLLTVNDLTQRHQATVIEQGDTLMVCMDEGTRLITRFNGQLETNSHVNNTAQLTSPMPGTIVAILKNKGDWVKTGDRLMVLEAMKMEHAILAPRDGLIADVFFTLGEQVQEGIELLVLAPITEPAS